MLFVGLGVDFGIQFSVRYRTERHEHGDLHERLRSAARKAGDRRWRWRRWPPRSGFFSFLPTDYRGLSELGLIAGCGMLIAFACSITLVPAMLACSIRRASPSRSASKAWRRSTIYCSGIA